MRSSMSRLAQVAEEAAKKKVGGMEAAGINGRSELADKETKVSGGCWNDV